ncbi:MAG TPA: cupredoxin domain-containing protein [Anaeromyxobacteraceae bacterium]|nr:cupredoxin domain-containing protein [Anaeromyxobacteraceae bacterium]
MRLLAILVVALALPAYAADKAAAPAAAGKAIQIKVTENGFEPQEIKVKKGQPVTLTFLRTTDRTCIKAIDIPAEKVKGFELPLDKPVSLTITPAKAGVEKFHCTAMAMGNGKIVVE